MTPAALGALSGLPGRAVRALLALGLLALSVMWVGPLRAAGVRVVVLRPPGASGAILEAVTRTRAELEAEGFEVLLRDQRGEADQRAALEQAAASDKAQAAVAISSVVGAAAADLWVADRITGKTLVRRVRVDELPAPERPRALAIRAVELLRASLIETSAPATRDHPHAPVPAEVSRWLGSERAPLQGPHAQLSIALLTSFDGIGPAGGPQLRLGWGLDIGLAVRLSVLAPALGSRPEGALGSATVRQSLGTVDLVYAPLLEGTRFVPLVWIGGGLYHLYASGDLRPPHVGISDEVLAAAGVLGAGVGYRLHPQVMAVLDAAALLTAPRAQVTIFGEPIGSAGRPSLSSSLGVMLSF